MPRRSLARLALSSHRRATSRAPLRTLATVETDSLHSHRHTHDHHDHHHPPHHHHDHHTPYTPLSHLHEHHEHLRHQQQQLLRIRNAMTSVAPSPSQEAAAVAPTKPETFYMRELPVDTLVGYESTAGKALFAAALAEGGMEAFFPLSQQFLTQSEPAYCGLGTLCMILNALKIDPAATWRTPWRWFTQEMLDCCRPLTWIKENGITLAEFTCLAKCNGLEATTRYAHETTFEEFEQAVKDCTSSTEQLLAVSFSRASLGQTGDGHFSPIGGYTSMNGGMVLVLDVARFKYPSYWVPIRALFDALIPPDKTTKKPRGYCILRRPSLELPAPALLTLNATTPTWPLLYAPLAAAAASSTTYESLISSLCTILQSPTGLPTVTSRFTSHNHVPSEYRRGVAKLYRYFAENSRLYQEVDGEWRTEITVFLLALLSSRDMRERMQAVVRAEVERRIAGDLADEGILAEVTVVRRMLEGLTECSMEEGKCERPVCCGGKRCL